MPSRRATTAPVLLHRHARLSLLWPTLGCLSARMPADSSPLEASVSIVHIPVHLAQHYTNELYWTLERAKECEFFNLTANRIEVSQPWSSWPSSRSTGGDREARAAACDRSLLLCRPPGGGVGSVRESTLPRRRAQLACCPPRHAARHYTALHAVTTLRCADVGRASLARASGGGSDMSHAVLLSEPIVCTPAHAPP